MMLLLSQAMPMHFLDTLAPGEIPFVFAAPSGAVFFLSAMDIILFLHYVFEKNYSKCVHCC